MVNQGLAWQGPILDNHFHLNRNGRYLDAAKDFKNAGGTSVVLVHCPDFSAPPRPNWVTVNHIKTRSIWLNRLEKRLVLAFE